MLAQTTICPHCSGTIKGGIRFCTGCGWPAPQWSLSPTPQPLRRPSKRRHFIMLLAVALVTTGLACAGICLLSALFTPDQGDHASLTTSSMLPTTTVPAPAFSPTSAPAPAFFASDQVKLVANDGSSITAWHVAAGCQPDYALGELSPGTDARVLDQVCYHSEQQTHFHQVVLADGTTCWIRAVDLIPTAQYTPLATDTPILTNTPLPTPSLEPTPVRTEAQVVEVIDGDTIKVSIAGEVYTLRYIGIDTPEIVHPTKPAEWMGPEASAANKALVGGKTVYLEKDISETDKYGRLLRYVFLPDGTFVNAELVRQGYAVSSTYAPDVKYQDLFRRVEQEAWETERGLWGPTPTLAPATPTPTSPATAAPTQPPPAPAGRIVISYIYYDGQVRQVESDEYAEITNTGSAAVNLKGWRLNADDPGQDFWFPDFVMQPGQSCRVYTNEDHAEHCGFSFGSGRALWNNSDRECGHLYNAAGVEVSTKCY